jgi:Tripartite tricarboxylate transporter family receptor
VEQVKPLLGTVVVENIGDGGSSLGAAAVARARPDGYIILLGGSQIPQIRPDCQPLDAGFGLSCRIRSMAKPACLLAEKYRSRSRSENPAAYSRSSR